MSEDTKRALHIPMPMTGRPERKRFFNWNTWQWETVTVIVLGVREDPPGMTYAERMRRRRRFAVDDMATMAEPDFKKRKPAPTPTPASHTIAGKRRAQMLKYLFEVGETTASDLAKHLNCAPGVAKNLLDNDPLTVGTVADPGRHNPQVYILREQDDGRTI